jgi:thioredoxin-dependent peroxiredoxin
MFITAGAGLSMFASSFARSPLKAGDTPPDFALPDQDGKIFILHEEIGKQMLVIFFYPRDETRGCTKEACSFRDHFETFTEAGATVIGINSAPPEKHKQFAENHRLPFRILSDPKNRVGASFGVKSMFGISGRETFLIGRSGKILFHFASMMQFDRHVTHALEIIRAQPDS